MIYDILLLIYVAGVVFGLWHIFRKSGVAPWKAVVPVWNIYEWLKITNCNNWKWWVGFVVPGINIFTFLLLVVETARCFRRGNFFEQMLGVMFPCFYLPLLGLGPDGTDGPDGGNGTAALVKTQENGQRWLMVWHDPKTDPPAKISNARDWSEAIVFALIAAVLIRGFVFELFSIPSSSMEKSLVVGDHLFVSKMAYGPRVIMTPLSLPLMHNVIPGTNTKSYLDWPHFSYHRYPGYTHVKRYDAVVFNFPAGDTILSNFPDGKYTYYDAVRRFGREAVLGGECYDPDFGPLGRPVVRPVDKRENYIKRCMGLPGEDLQIVDKVVHINGKPVELPTDAQFEYDVVVAAGYNYSIVLDACGVSQDDIRDAIVGRDDAGNIGLCVPLTAAMAASLQASPTVLLVQPTEHPVDNKQMLFPNDTAYRWSVDNYGPVHIPAKGEPIALTIENLPFYRRVITTYEGNTLEVRDGQILINGTATDSYTPRMDYYWMMGDNRHHSQDSRYWGFVPEDHIVGRAERVLWSTNGKAGLRILRDACQH